LKVKLAIFVGGQRVIFTWLFFYFLALEVRTFDRSLLDSQLLAKGQILQDKITSADKEATNRNK
jgi:hypothetical protein